MPDRRRAQLPGGHWGSAPVNSRRCFDSRLLRLSTLRWRRRGCHARAAWTGELDAGPSRSILSRRLRACVVRLGRGGRHRRRIISHGLGSAGERYASLLLGQRGSRQGLLAYWVLAAGVWGWNGVSLGGRAAEGADETNLPRNRGCECSILEVRAWRAGSCWRRDARVGRQLGGRGKAHVARHRPSPLGILEPHGTIVCLVFRVALKGLRQKRLMLVLAPPNGRLLEAARCLRGTPDVLSFRGLVDVGARVFFDRGLDIGAVRAPRQHVGRGVVARSVVQHGRGGTGEGGVFGRCCWDTRAGNLPWAS